MFARKFTGKLLSVAVVAFLGGCAAETQESAVVWGSPLSSEAGLYESTFTPEPAEPRTGKNVVHMMLKDEQGATVEVEPWMPAHGHGSPETPQVMEHDAGHYHVSNIVYSMPGEWRLTFDVDGSAGQDSFVLVFDVL